jgi:hypothetical protein
VPNDGKLSVEDQGMVTVFKIRSVKGARFHRVAISSRLGLDLVRH